MKRLLFLLLFVCFSLFSFAQTTVDVLRKEYQRASSDSAACIRLYEKVVNDKSTDNTISCYKGAIHAAMANHVKNRSEKLKLFNTGKKLIEDALKADPENTELHFLRLTIQLNCPKALGYNDKVQEDKMFILSNLESLKSASLKKNISSFMLASANLTSEEKKMLNPGSK